MRLWDWMNIKSVGGMKRGRSCSMISSVNIRQKRNEIIGVMIEGEWIEEVEEWRWRRGLFDRELPLLNDMLTLINMWLSRQGVQDEWRWNRARDYIYSTKITYD
ncbi:hypothetical protein ACS0TY_015627 [Phlomoides rotata]